MELLAPEEYIVASNGVGRMAKHCADAEHYFAAAQYFRLCAKLTRLSQTPMCEATAQGFDANAVNCDSLARK